MGKTLYLECYSGISGDMTAAALLDLGADREVLQRTLDSLMIQGFQVEITRVFKSGIDACDFRVILDEAHENHDHDMEYLYGHEHGHKHEHEHTHEHEHAHTHAHHHHEHRGMREIREIIAKADMTEGARSLALRIFTILAEAEAKAHNLPVDEVHFHEVGAIDSIVDILSVAVCLDNLKIEKVIVPFLCEGRGTVRCQHGILPIPVPAVANIAQAHALNLQMVNVEGELVTPTGAAIVAAIMTQRELPKEFEIEKIGIGAGKREYERAGILRAMLIRDRSEERDTIYKLETNVDDCSGEALGYVMERLFEAGARDVHYTPVFMKKNRPAWQLNVICRKEDRKKLEDIIFAETTTIGIRRVEMERTVLSREQRTVETVFGSAKVKVCRLSSGEIRPYPEYESVIALCREQGLSYGTVYAEIVRCCMEEERH